MSLLSCIIRITNIFRLSTNIHSTGASGSLWLRHTVRSVQDCGKPTIPSSDRKCWAGVFGEFLLATVTRSSHFTHPKTEFQGWKLSSQGRGYGPKLLSGDCTQAARIFLCPCDCFSACDLEPVVLRLTWTSQSLHQSSGSLWTQEGRELSVCPAVSAESVSGAVGCQWGEVSNLTPKSKPSMWSGRCFHSFVIHWFSPKALRVEMHFIGFPSRVPNLMSPLLATQWMHLQKWFQRHYGESPTLCRRPWHICREVSDVLPLANPS